MGLKFWGNIRDGVDRLLIYIGQFLYLQRFLLLKVVLVLLLLLLTLSKQLLHPQCSNALSVEETTVTREAAPGGTWRPATAFLSRLSIRDGTPLEGSSIARSVHQQRNTASTVKTVT